MEFIDPQLLDWENTTCASSQPEQFEFSYTDYLFNENNQTYSPPHPDYSSAYPEEPLIARDPNYQPGFTFHPELPPQPTYTPPEFPCAQYSVRHVATQTTDRPFPQPMPVAQTHHRYTLRPRKAQYTEKSTRAEMKAEQKKKRNRQKTGKLNRFLRQNPLKEPLTKFAARLRNFREMDLEAYVRRGMEERVDNERVCRPVNAFMLYRMAYVKAARAVLKGTPSSYVNISWVVAASWTMESREVKERFQQLADEERKQHARLFPRYRYIRGLKKACSGHDSDGSEIIFETIVVS